MTYWDALGDIVGNLGPTMLIISMVIVAALWLVGNGIILAVFDELYEFWEYVIGIAVLIAWFVGGGIPGLAYLVWGTNVLYAAGVVS